MKINAKKLFNLFNNSTKKEQYITTIPAIVIPKDFYAVSGRECNIYFRNILNGFQNNYSISINVKDNNYTYGFQQDQRWTYIPNVNYLNISGSITIYDPTNYTEIENKTFYVHVAASDTVTQYTLQNPLKVMQIGDSLTAGGVITEELLNISNNDILKLKMIGTCHTEGTSKENVHEGRNGWMLKNYIEDPSVGTVVNPFFINGKFDFSAYLSKYNLETPNLVIIALGVNDMGSMLDDTYNEAVVDQELTFMDKMISSIKQANTSIKIAIALPPVGAAEQDAYSNLYRQRDRYKRNILIWCNKFINKYAGQAGNNIYIIPTETAIDTVHCYQREATANPVNSRCSDEKIKRQIDSIHPAHSGYYQLADAIWAFIKNQLY